MVKLWSRDELHHMVRDTKSVDIFLRFPRNIGMSQADKPSNNYGHWKTARGEIFDGNLKTD
jgi:hypothetical protein